MWDRCVQCPVPVFPFWPLCQTAKLGGFKLHFNPSCSSEIFPILCQEWDADAHAQGLS